MDKLTVMQKKIILIGLGLLILICSFFLVFQRNQDQATELDAQSQKLAPEQQVDTLSQMVGKYTKYEVDMTGNMNQIMDMVDWVRDNKEHMSISNLSYTFDATSGKLTGTATINYYEINGNGNPYIEPKIDGIVIGTDSIFGALQK